MFLARLHIIDDNDLDPSNTEFPLSSQTCPKDDALSRGATATLRSPLHEKADILNNGAWNSHVLQEVRQ